MKKFLGKVMTVAVNVALCASFCTPVHAEDSVQMWRLYNPNSGEHFYTRDSSERDHLYDAGWNIEGVGWVAPAEGQDVYRLYNKVGGEHHYTTDASERDHLVSVGWKYEGVGWQSGGDVSVYRQYNPNAFANNHNYTADTNEKDHLIRLGWHDEKVAWQAVAGGSAEGRRIHQKHSQSHAPASQSTVYNGPFYVTKTGKKYHRANCPTIRNSRNLIPYNTREEVRKLGYEPCSDCKPDE